tara:strand:- start:53 stop:658 length:606 start_codon:yes stop_codon:yes gene_type:complete
MTKGKNFSANNSKGQRKKSDFYETPYSITEHLLEVEPFDYTKTVCEPACGNNAITNVLQKKWNDVTAYDIERNFLFETNQYDYIITNPPFSLAYEFICKAKSIAREKFAMLLPLSYLHGKKRYDNVYSDRKYGLKKVYVFTRYPMLGEPLREDGKYNTGMMVYAWYIFENGYSDNPIIDWIDNNSDVLSMKDKKECNIGNN